MNTLCNFEKSLKQHFTKQQQYSYCLPFHKSSKYDEQDTWDTAGEVRMKQEAIFSHGLLFMDVPVLADQQGLTDIISVWMSYMYDTIIFTLHY